jgi:hypothetical protein
MTHEVLPAAHNEPRPPIGALWSHFDFGLGFGSDFDRDPLLESRPASLWIGAAKNHRAPGCGHAAGPEPRLAPAQRRCNICQNSPARLLRAAGHPPG